MSEEDISEEYPDPTPIHHPVDSEAIESAVTAAAAEVADKEEPSKEDELARVEPRKRARRVGRVDVKPAKYAKFDSGVDPHLEALAADSSDPVRQEAAARVIEAEAFIPKVVSKHDEKWNHMFNRLVAFKEKHKHTNVPQMYDDSPRLGRWVHYQRVEYWLFHAKGGSAKITPERIARLEELGFEWDPQQAQWEKMFDRLVKYKEAEGHCKVPKGYMKDIELANWVRNQRLEHANKLKGKKSRMTDERFRRLDDLGFKWSNISTAKIVQPVIPEPVKEDQQSEITEQVPMREAAPVENNLFASVEENEDKGVEKPDNSVEEQQVEEI
eukprot:CAMPEP_0176009660 /NCGR_PEP_ID=MMETSP0120_2-20121206/4364_1 /TAXON_ID=160619 /ORGANISM="Kryptoperidinium foliaceum, Strain CCMP 1326" /LENGTH=326 /DNA_ID=CAMNT_0017342461 /DNA_START=16 /DNA_END=996 /DNA_ORIENTATION=-